MYLSETRQPALGRRKVAGTVIVLGTVSLITDVSAEMVTAVLPLYLVAGLGLSPLQFGFIDGLYTGATAVARLAGGHVADRWQRPKSVAALGYGLSAAAKLLLLAAGSAVTGIGAAIAADRVGKGIRTAPRDALISLSSHPGDLGRAFGVHRAMDTAGALAGPMVAFGLLWYTAGYLPLQQRIGLAIEYFPLLPLGSALSYLILAVPIGALSDRFGRWLFFICGYLALALVYVMLLTPMAGAGLLVACLVLHGGFYAATDGVLAAAASATLPQQLRSSGLALLMTGQAMGRLGASVGFGALWVAWGTQTALIVVLIALTAACAGARVWRAL